MPAVDRSELLVRIEILAQGIARFGAVAARRLHTASSTVELQYRH